MTAPSPGHETSPAATATQEWWGTEDACVRYGDRLALDHVTFRAVPGRVSAVVGGDGAGRTTLLRCLAGAHAVTSGRVRLPPPLRIGYLSAGSGTYPDLSVDENLAFRATAYQMPPATARERGNELLERAGLAGARDRLAGQLSGGMRQKLGVIAAMLHQPDLLVLDEPTTGVDPVSRADLWWLLALAAGRELAAGTPQEIIAAMPGTLRVSDTRPDGEARRRAWRRGGRWRIWDPAGQPGLPGPGAAAGGAGGQAGSTVAPDLQDAVTVAILARELAGARAGNGRPEGGDPR